jgi:hypothetical protein
MRLTIGAVSTVLLAAGAWANWNDTSTGFDLTKLPAFPLTKVRSGLLKDGAEVRFDGIAARMMGPTGAVGEVDLQGTSKSRKRWSVHFSWIVFDQVYRGDLDGNGIPDYVVIGGAGGNGRLAPPGTITVVLLDQQGLPVPFEAPLYDDLGPRHVVDVLHDGRAQLALGAYDENGWDNRSGVFCSGHWVTDLYETTGFNWQGFQGAVGSVTFPLVHRWTYWPDCNYPSPEPWKEFVGTGQYSTASADIARLETSDSGWAKLAPAEGCDSFGVGMIVYDQRGRRDIALAANSEYAEDLLERILADKAEVALRGVQRKERGYCTANLLWASK